VTRTDWDVVVVGGGPAGAAAARVATGAGARVLLVEREPAPRGKVCGEYLCPGGVAELEELGFGRELAAARTAPLLGMRLFGPGDRTVLTHFPTGQAGLSVRRCELDALLADASGAEVRRGAKVTDVTRAADGARTVHFADGATARARVVVGADGRRSVVARRCGLHRAPAPPFRVTLHGFVSGLRETGAYGEMHMPGDGTYVGLNPGPDGLVNVTYVCDLAGIAAGLARAREELFLRALTACPSLRARAAAARVEGRVRVLAPLRVRPRRVYADGVLLAGDAAGFLDPLTGEGMYGALVSGRLAGQWAASGASSARELRGYARARRRALGRKELLNRAFQWVIRRPRALDFLGRRLDGTPLGDILIGVIGNVEGPAALLRPRHLYRLLAGGPGA